MEDYTLSDQQVEGKMDEDDDPKSNEYELHESLADPKRLEQDLSAVAPTSPALLYSANNATYSMPIRHIRVRSECHIATAFVTMSILFQNTSRKKVNALFVVPCPGTVTSATVSINEGARFLDTTFIDKESAAQFGPKGKAQEEASKYIPDLFKLPVANVAKGETVRITVDLMLSLPFVESRYHLLIPMNFGTGILPKGHCIDIECTINCLTPGIEYGSSTHRLALTERQNLRCRLAATPKNVTSSNQDFHLHFLCRTNAISAAVLNDDATKSFVCFVNPPMAAPSAFGRDVVFLIDRSGSMGGRPYKDAVQGLKFALGSLTPRDRFAVIAFDHEHVIFDPAAEGPGGGALSLHPADAQTVQRAVHFLDTTPVRGMTDIRTPLLIAMEHLNRNGESSGNVPFCVLLTDGAVEDEKEIVAAVAAMESNRTRILSFGIGSYCNEYFLKMLSSKTRGWHSGCIYPSDLFPKMAIMMDRAKTPILTEVVVEIPDSVEATVFPETTPDLFVNGPIVISGKYKGSMPSQLAVAGKMGTGQTLRIPVRVDVSRVVPIEKVMVKQRMDALVARHWLTGDEAIKKEAVALSVEQTFPSPYTEMVAFQLTPEEKEKADREKKSNAKKKGLSGGQIAALTGGAVVVGAGVFLLGAAALTSANVNVVGAIGDGLGNVGDLFGAIDCPCDSCLDAVSCGNCDCGALANLFSCGGCGDCDGCLDAIPCGECDGGCAALPGCDCIGDLCDSCGGLLGGCCETIGDGCGTVCGFVPECIGGIAGAAGECCGSLGGLCGDLCGSLGDLCGNLDGVCEAIGGICGGIGDVCGDLCGDICGVVDDVL